MWRLGHRVVGDRLGEAFDDRRLADTRLTDEDRVVLGAAAEDLHDPFGRGWGDDRIEAFSCCLREVAAELVGTSEPDWLSPPEPPVVAPAFSPEPPEARFPPDGARVARQQLDDLLTHPAEIGTELDENLSGNALTRESARAECARCRCSCGRAAVLRAG